LTLASAVQARIPAFPREYMLTRVRWLREFRVSWRNPAWSPNSNEKQRCFRRERDALQLRARLLERDPSILVSLEVRRIRATRWAPLDSESAGGRRR
jgi:hypothetical protein